MQKTTYNLILRLPPHLAADLRRFTQRTGMSRTEAIRRAIAQFVAAPRRQPVGPQEYKS